MLFEAIGGPGVDKISSTGRNAYGFKAKFTSILVEEVYHSVLSFPTQEDV